MKRITAKAADALDLAIEFATLGEYGLEYPEEAAESMPAPSPAPCRPGRQRKRPATRIAPPPRTRPVTTIRPGRRRHSTCGTRTVTRLPEALLPPRIKLDYPE